MVSTAGLPFLLQTRDRRGRFGQRRGPRPPPSCRRPGSRLIERLRRVEEPVLDSLLVSSLSPELGPDDVAAALRLDAEEAQRLVDRARASGSDRAVTQPGVPRSVHGSRRPDHRYRTASRHRDRSARARRSNCQRCQSDLALRMAEHGLRDDRLANALADLASHSRSQPARAARLYRAAARSGSDGASAPGWPTRLH